MTETDRDPALARLMEELAGPFDAKDVKYKPQQVKNNRALAMAYIDARLIQDRLDKVLGTENWQDSYRILHDGSVVCRLRLRLGGKWIAKCDVGSPSEQPDAGDRLKAAFSDALKRAAVKFGIGRYLYRLKAEWCDYDPAKKQFTQSPSWAAEKPKAQAPQQQKPAPAQKQTSAEELRPALDAAKQAAAWTWDDCVRWLNAQNPSEPIRYGKETRLSDIEPARAQRLVKHLQSLVQTDPLHSWPAFESLLKAKNKDWSSAISWLNSQTDAKYNPVRVAWLDIDVAHRKLVVDALNGAPTAQKKVG